MEAGVESKQSIIQAEEPTFVRNQKRMRGSNSLEPEEKRHRAELFCIFHPCRKHSFLSLESPQGRVLNKDEKK